MLHKFSANRRRKRTAAAWSALQLESRVLPSAVSVVSTLHNNGSTSLTFTGTDGDDLIGLFRNGAGQIEISNNGPGGTFSINGGPDLQSFTVNALRDLAFDLKGGNDQLFFGDITADDIEIVDGVAAAETASFVFVSPVAGSAIDDLDIQFGQGSVVLSLNAPSAALSFDEITLNAASASNAGVFLTSTGGPITVDDLHVTSSGLAGIDTVLFTANAASSSIVIADDLTLSLGGGADTVRIVGNVAIGGETNISTGAGDDLIEFNPGFSNPTPGLVLGGDVGIQTGDGKDWVQILAQGTPSRVVAEQDVTISMGGQNDIAQIFGLRVDGRLDIAMGNSDLDPSLFGAADVVSLGNTEIFGKTGIESAGLANVYLFAANSALQPMRFHGNASFRLGSGFVDASFVFDAESKVVFDGRQVYTGVNETITVKYGASVVFQLNKRKLFNAVVI